MIGRGRSRGRRDPPDDFRPPGVQSVPALPTCSATTTQIQQQQKGQPDKCERHHPLKLPLFHAIDTDSAITPGPFQPTYCPRTSIRDPKHWNHLICELGTCWNTLFKSKQFGESWSAFLMIHGLQCRTAVGRELLAYFSLYQKDFKRFLKFMLPLFEADHMIAYGPDTLRPFIALSFLATADNIQLWRIVHSNLFLRPSEEHEAIARFAKENFRQGFCYVDKLLARIKEFDLWNVLELSAETFQKGIIDNVDVLLATHSSFQVSLPEKSTFSKKLKKYEISFDIEEVHKGRLMFHLEKIKNHHDAHIYVSTTGDRDRHVVSVWTKDDRVRKIAVDMIKGFVNGYKTDLSCKVVDIIYQRGIASYLTEFEKKTGCALTISSVPDRLKEMPNRKAVIYGLEPDVQNAFKELDDLHAKVIDGYVRGWVYKAISMDLDVGKHHGTNTASDTDGTFSTQQSPSTWQEDGTNEYHKSDLDVGKHHGTAPDTDGTSSSWGRLIMTNAMGADEGEIPDFALRRFRPDSRILPTDYD